MANNKLSVQTKKAFAKILYTREQLEGKIVADRVGVSEKTISKWVNENEGEWKRLRNRLLASKENQLNLLYDQLEALNTEIQNSEKKYADTKQADVIIKLTAAIRSLETDLNIADLVESGIRFVKYIQSVGSFDQVTETAELWNSFLQSQIKR